MLVVICVSFIYSLYSSRHLETKWDLQDRPDSLNLYAEQDNKQDRDAAAEEDNLSQDSQREQKVLQFLENSKTNPAPLIDDATSVLENENGFKDETDGDDVHNSSSPTCSQEVVDTNLDSSGHLDLKFYHSPLW